MLVYILTIFSELNIIINHILITHFFQFEEPLFPTFLGPYLHFLDANYLLSPPGLHTGEMISLQFFFPLSMLA